MEVNPEVYETLREGKQFRIESWKLAQQADWSVTINLGETTLLVTSVMNKDPDPDKGFLPLMIDFRESFYAGWKIWWAIYIRREGKPGDHIVLNARLTDRPLRPMFPEGMVNDTIITVTPLSVDKENSMWVPSIIGASLATMLAGIPFDWPVGAVKIGYKDQELIVNPTYEEINNWMLDLTLAGTENEITMVECWASEIDDETLMKAFEKWQEEIKKVCQMQKEFLKNFEIQQQEITINYPSTDLTTYIKQLIKEDELEELIPSSKKEFNEKFQKIEDNVIEKVQDKIDDNDNEVFTESKVKTCIFNIVKEFIRNKILYEDKRIDWRDLDQIRPLYCEAGSVSRIHGDWLFQRWETQVFSATTLGAPWDVLLVDDMETDSFEKRFMHHYNMPGFSTNETKPSRAASRREIGHWKLAEKALEPIIPDEEEFPYTIRIVSEVLSCNWSTSMGSVCASTLSLLDAWVPIKSPVAWVAMGLVTDNENYKILTDIQWAEDFTWDMDFKVAGTKNWITALQMDMKIQGLSLEIIRNAIKKANKKRNEILDFMLKTIDKPREELNIHAPKITTLQLTPSQIRDVIWPWWTNINEIIRQSNAKVDFKDDGTTIITTRNSYEEQEALRLIKESSWQPQEWEVLEGTITRVESYGVFVDLWKGKTGLCHVKNLWEWFISDPKVMFKENDQIRVKITGIDKDWKIQLRKES